MVCKPSELGSHALSPLNVGMGFEADKAARWLPQLSSLDGFGWVHVRLMRKMVHKSLRSRGDRASLGVLDNEADSLKGSSKNLKMLEIRSDRENRTEWAP